MNNRKDNPDLGGSRADFDGRSAGKISKGSTLASQERKSTKAAGAIPEQEGCGPNVTEYPFLDKEDAS